MTARSDRRPPTLADRYWRDKTVAHFPWLGDVAVTSLALLALFLL